MQINKDYDDSWSIENWEMKYVLYFHKDDMRNQIPPVSLSFWKVSWDEFLEESFPLYRPVRIFYAHPLVLVR